MGQCYDVRLKAQYLDEKGAADALRAKIARADSEAVNYSLDHFESIGIGTESLSDLLRIFFGGWDGVFGESATVEGWLDSGYGFNCCYGWEGVMMGAFEEMAPFLKDGSAIKIYPDSGCDYGKVKDGKVIWR